MNKHQRLFFYMKYLRPAFPYFLITITPCLIF